MLVNREYQHKKRHNRQVVLANWEYEHKKRKKGKWCWRIEITTIRRSTFFLTTQGTKNTDKVCVYRRKSTKNDCFPRVGNIKIYTISLRFTRKTIRLTQLSIQ